MSRYIQYRERGRTQTIPVVEQLLSCKPGSIWTLLEDTNTGSTWDIVTGTAVAGPLTGIRLHRAPHHNSYWFAWVDFYLHTTLFQAP
jgi:hypothetical protein